MCTHDFTDTGRDDALVICPQCGGSDYKDNRIDEALYREAAKEAPRLRFEGKIDEAVVALTALYAIRIVNFVRPQWRCVCGASFDGYPKPACASPRWKTRRAR